MSRPTISRFRNRSFPGLIPPLLESRIEIGETQVPLEISDIFENGEPNRYERKMLRRVFQSFNSLNINSDDPQQVTANSEVEESAEPFVSARMFAKSINSQVEESAEPFVSASTLAKSTEYINNSGDALGAAVSNIQFAPVTKGGDFKFSTYGNLAEYHVDINGKIEGKSSMGKAVLNIERLNNKISGLDALVKDSFSSLTPIDPITGSSQQQSVPYSVKSDSGYQILDETDFYIKVKAYWPEGFPAYGALFSSIEVKGGFGISSPYGAMEAGMDSIINYDSDNKQADLGDYNVRDVVIKPSMADAWDRYWQPVFGNVSDWWDNKISKKNNPFTYIYDAVSDQLISGENLLTNQVESVVNGQLNSSSIKPYIDSPFEALYGAAWDRQTYPLSGGWTEG